MQTHPHPPASLLRQRLSRALSRSLWWGLLGLVSAGLLGLLVLTHGIASDAERMLARQTRERVETDLARQQQTFRERVIEYTFWDDTYRNATLSPDPAWLEQQVEGALRQHLGVSRVFLVTASGVVQELVGSRLMAIGSAHSRLVPQVQMLADLVRQEVQAHQAPRALSAFLGDGQAVYLTGVGLALPSGAGSAGAGGWHRLSAETSAVVFLRELDTDWLAEMRRGLGLAHLSLGPVATRMQDDDLLLTTWSGVPVATLLYEYPVSVRGLPGWLAVGVVVTLLLFVGLSVFLTRRRSQLALLAAAPEVVNDEINAAVVQAVQDGVLVIDRTGQIVRANPAVAAMFGYAVEDLEGQSLDLLLKSEDRAAHAMFLQKATLYAPRVISQARALEAVHRDGSIIEVTLTVMPLATGDAGGGQGDGFIGLIRDVTRLRQEQEMLDRIRQRFRVLTENAPVGIYVHRHFRPLFANQTMLDMFGLESKTAFSALTSTAQLLAPEERDAVRVIHEKRLRGEDAPREFLIRCVRQDGGGDLWCKNVSFTLDWDGELAVCTMLMDITAEVTARREQEAVLARLRTVISTTGEGYLFTDPNAIIIEVNAAAVTLLGWRESELLGMPLMELVTPTSRPFLLSQLERRMTTAHRSYRLEFLHRNGTAVMTEVAASSLFDDEGRLTGSFAFFRDISATLAYEKALRVAKEEADRANRAKSEFLSNMSHELRTPLNAILGFAQLLTTGRNATLAPRQQEYVQHITQSGELLLALINEVLDLARIETGGLSLSVEPVRAGDLIDQSLSVARVLAKGRQIMVQYQPGPEQDMVLLADMTRARQVLLNLLSNAVKYNVPQGRVVLSLSRGEGETLRFTVEDTGLGIPPEKQYLIFEPFNRLGQEQSTIEGTGIGLTITKALVEKMEGRIGFSSTAGVGSVFWFELPLDPTALKPAQDVAVVVPGPALFADTARLGIGSGSGLGAGDAAGGDPGATLPPCRLLYIEDNPGNRALLEEVFRPLSQVQLQTAATAEIGLAQAHDAPPDLIILDINLPNMDGFTALERLRADLRTRAVPVIGLSANATAGAIQRAQEVGFDAYLTKPVNIPVLLETLRQVLGGAEPPQPAPGLPPGLDAARSGMTGSAAAAGPAPPQTHRT